MKEIPLIRTTCLIQILLVLSIVSHASETVIPNDARLLIEKRDVAVQAIDRRLIEELEKIKMAHTKRGDLDSANAIVSLIKKYKTDEGAKKDPSAQIARLEGIWIRDSDKTLFEFDSKGNGVWKGRDKFIVTYDTNLDQFELKSPNWPIQELRFVDSNPKILTGKKYILTRLK